MNCFYCKGTFKESFTNHVVNFKNSVIIIKNVPCTECTQCGEAFYNDDVTMQLEKIVAIIKSADISEVAIVNFSDKAA